MSESNRKLCMRRKEIARLDKEIRNCKKCRLHKTRIKAVPGEGPVNARIMICGQAPGRTEDREGRPFVGMAGKFLNELLESMGQNRKRIFISSPIKCFPPNNRPPKSDELKACKPYLEEQIRIIKPRIIIALGNYALQALLGRKLKISQHHGEPQERNEIIIFPTFHPAAAMRFPKIRTLMEEDFERLKHLLKKVSPRFARREGYRNVGIGTKMAKTSVGQAKKMGLKMLYLGVFSTNKVAYHVHEKVGFKEHIRLKKGDKFYAIKKGKLKDITIVEESVIMKLDLK